MRLLPEKSVKGVTFALLRVVILVYLGLGVVLYLRQDRMIFFPDQTPFTDCPQFSDAAQVNMEGTRGYFFSYGSSSDLIVLYHGNAGRACDREAYNMIALSSRVSILLVEYTGYAGDGAPPSVRSLLRDVEHVEQWAKMKAPKRLIIIGESIGSGPASYHASLSRPQKLALIAPFDRLHNVAADVYPVYPMGILLKDDLHNEKWARGAGSVLIIHGTNDPAIHFSHGKALFDSLPQSDKQFIALPGATHEDVLSSYQTFSAIMHYITDKETN